MSNFENELTSLITRTSELGLSLESDFAEKIISYCSLLREYNSHTNLVGNDSWTALLNEHVLDSLTLVPLLRELAPKNTTSKLIDIGSGAGFPGIVLAAAEKDLQAILLDSIAKKCRFLSQAAVALNLQERINVLCERAELAARTPALRGSFHFATARAVSSLPVVSELCLPFLKIGGRFLAQRSDKQVEAELADSRDFIAQLGGKVVQQHKIDLAVTGRNLQILIIEKEKETPSRFPRSPAQIKRDRSL